MERVSNWNVRKIHEFNFNLDSLCCSSCHNAITKNEILTCGTRFKKADKVLNYVVLENYVISMCNKCSCIEESTNEVSIDIE